MTRRTSIPILIAAVCGVVTITVKIARNTAPHLTTGIIAGVLPSALTTAAFSWICLLVVRTTTTKRAMIAGVAAGAVLYEIQQPGMTGRTFDWWDAIAAVVACVPALVLAPRYGARHDPQPPDCSHSAGEA